MLLRNYILLSYPLSIITFFLIAVFSKEAKKRTHGFLNAANYLILLILFVNLVLTLVAAFNCQEHLKNNFLREDADYGMEISRHCFRMFYATLFTGFLFQLLFLWKKYRIKKWITLLSVLLITILVFLETLIVAITNLYRDYIPSAWVREAAPFSWKFVVLTVVYFLICWIAAGFRTAEQNGKP